jgi:riboflavin kinase/FMN adenylyltransferase
VTFDPHPSAVVRPDTQPLMLSTVAHRVALLEQAGADDVLVLPFSTEMASWTPAEFVERVLVRRLAASGVVVGEGFRFGHRAAGDVALLQKLGAEHGFSARGGRRPRGRRRRGVVVDLRAPVRARG